MPPAEDPDSSDKISPQGRRRIGLGMVAGAVVVFVVCSLVQSAAGSSMFSTRYSASVNVAVGLLVSMTFYFGWVVTLAALLIGGLLAVSSFVDQDTNRDLES